MEVCLCDRCNGAAVSRRTAYRHRQHNHDPEIRSDVDQSTYNVFGASEPLFKGCNWTSLAFHTNVIDIKNRYAGVSENCVTEFLTLFKNVLDGGQIPNNVSTDYSTCKSYVSDILPPTVQVSICVNECVIFHGDTDSCSVCGEPRKDSKGRDRNFFYYAPIIPRITKLFHFPAIRKMLEEHHHVTTRDGLMRDIWDSPHWKHLFGSEGIFANEPHNIVLGMMEDGADPWKKKAPTSIWCTVMKIYNLPPGIRDKFENTISCSISKGPKMPSNFNLFHELLVSELLELESGVQVTDCINGGTLMVRGIVDKFIFDWPAGCKSCYRVGVGGKFPCFLCATKGTYSSLSKTSLYLDNRRMLSDANPMRKDTSGFPLKSIENRSPPRCKPPIKSQVLAIDCVQDNINDAIARKDKKSQRLFKQNMQSLKTRYGKTGQEIWCKLDHYSTECQMIDAMHTSANVIKTFLRVLRGVYSARAVQESLKSKGEHLKIRNVVGSKRKVVGDANSSDSGSGQAKRRKLPSNLMESENRSVRKEGTTEQTQEKEEVPTGNPNTKQTFKTKQEKANQLRKENETILKTCPETRKYVSNFTLGKKVLEEMDTEVSNIRVPSYFGPVPDQAFTHGYFQNTHQCIKMATEGILQFSIRNVLGEEERKVLIDVFFVLAMVNLPVVNKESIPCLKERIADVLARKEKLFPEFVNTLMCHLLIHMPSLMEKYGPTCHYSMFAGERLMSALMQRMKLQRKYPGKVALESSKTRFLCSLLDKASKEKKCVKPAEAALEQTAPSNLCRHVKYLVINKYDNVPSDLRCTSNPRVEIIHSLFGRKYAYKSIESSVHADSIVVCTKKDTLEDYIGEIQTVVSATSESINFKDKFLNLRWLGKCTFDRETRLWYLEECDVRPLPCLISLCDISSEWSVSRPLVHRATEDKFWILNFHELYIYHPEEI